jgi:mannose-6-phosphate isomerase-like protein (cupin superfamily)
VWLDGAETIAGPGAFLLVPRGTPHGLRRLSEEAVRMVPLVSPAGMERFFDAVVQQGEEELLVDPERLVALAAEHGTEIVGDYPR